MEQFLDKICNKHKINLNGVVYLGAEWAQEAKVFNDYGASFVFWVEALYSNIPHAEYNLRPFPNQKIVHAAICDKDYSQVDFYIYNHPAASSLFQKKDMNKFYPEHDIVGSVKVMGMTVDTLLELHDVRMSEVGLLAMDLQGAEMMALRGARKLLNSPSLKYICSEVVWEPLYEGGALKSEIDEFLKDYGFYEIDSEGHTPFPGQEMTPQADILYAR